MDGFQLRAAVRPTAVRAAWMAAYALAVLAGHATHAPGSQLAMMWPAAGVGYLWISRTGARRRGRVLDTVLLVATSATINWLVGFPLAVASLLAPATAVNALVATAVLPRLGGGARRMRSAADLYALVGASAAGAALSGCVGPLVLAVANGLPLASTEATWMLRNTVSTMVIASAYLLLRRPERLLRGGWGRGQGGLLEVLATCVVSGGAYGMTFWAQTGLPLAYIVVPLCAWVGLRLSTRAATVFVVLAGALVVTATWLGRGPFGPLPLGVGVPLAQSFIAVITVLTLVMALGRDERADLHTMLVRARDAAADQAQLLHAVLASTSEGVLIVDEHGNHFHSDAGRAIFDGAAPWGQGEREEWRSYHLDGTRMVPGDRPAARALAGEEVPSFTFTMRHRVTDEEVVLAGNAHPLVATEPGGRGGAVTVFRDVTAEHRASARLADSENLFRLSFDLAPVGMVLVSLSPGSVGRIRRVNRAFAQFTGRSEEELLAMERSDEVMHPDDRPQTSVSLSAFAAGTTESMASERRYLTPDGTVKWGALSNTVVHPEVGGDSYLMCIVEDITERKQTQDALTHLALHDALTGLPNRRLFRDRLEHALTGQARTGFDVGLLYIDLDGFKGVNDRLGHAIGDELLITVTTRLRACVRGDDTIARLGGDEFAVILSQLHAPIEGEKIAERIRAAVSLPIDTSAGPAAVGTSIGLAVATGDQDGELLVTQADAAMYRAKHAGKGRVVVHGDPTAERRTTHRAAHRADPSDGRGELDVVLPRR